MNRRPTPREALADVLATINVPRPTPIDGPTLLEALREPEARWRPHVEALFDEVSEEALHWLVLTGVTTFEALDDARRRWELGGARVDWIEEMARFSLARAARAHPAVR